MTEFVVILGSNLLIINREPSGEETLKTAPVHQDHFLELRSKNEGISYKFASFEGTKRGDVMPDC